MTAHRWLSLVAGGVQLALAFFVFLRRGRSPLSLPLGVLCFDLAGYNLASLAYEVSGAGAWHLVDVTLSPFSVPLALHFAVAFVGRTRALRTVLVTAYLLFACIAAMGGISALHEAWEYGFVAAEIPAVTFALALLVQHIRRAADPAERTRGRAIIAAFVVTAILGPTDLLDDFLPAMGNFGTLAGTLVFAAVTMRFELLGREIRLAVAAYALLLSALVLLGGVAVFRWMGASTAVVVLGAVAITAALLAATRAVMSAYATQRERTTHLAMLGRFSSQMQHDLKNPLATLKGALQFLKEEHARGRSLDAQHEFLDVMLEQVERLRRVVDEYHRIGRVEPTTRPTSVNALVESLLALQPFATTSEQGGTSRVSITTALADDLPDCHLDPDLVSNALENIVRNAIEAMPRGGTLAVRTERAAGGAGGRGSGIVVSIADTGEGMDARQMQQAFDDFFTTKASGSGLGLAFVRRVADAHGGAVSLARGASGGTVVRLELPEHR